MSVVAHWREHTPDLIGSDHRVFVIGAEHHHVRVPMTNSRSEILVRRPHVSKTDTVSSRKVAFDVCRLDTFGNLVRSLSIDGKFRSQFVTVQYQSRLWRAESDRCTSGLLDGD